MAINPQLLMILMQQAPGLLRAIKSQFPGDTKTPADLYSNDLNEAYARQYDMGMLEDSARGYTLDGRVDPHSAATALQVMSENMGNPYYQQGFPSDYVGDPSLGNLFKNLTLAQQQQIGGSPASLSAATFQANPPQMQDYQIPNPATGMSEEDWWFDDVDDETNPVKRAWLLEQIKKKRGM